MRVKEVIFEGPTCTELSEIANKARIKHVKTEGGLWFPVTSLASAKRLIKQLQELCPEDNIIGAFKFKVTQPFISLLPKLAEEEIQAMQAYVDNRITELGITVYKISKGSCGLAYFKERKIKIPKVKDVDTFCVCLHEIGHIINGPMRPVYASEYHTEHQALRMAKEYAETARISKDAAWLKALKQYEERAKAYVIWHIAKGYKRGLRMNALQQPIVKWLGYTDFAKWPGNRVEVKRYSNGYQVKLTPATI
jgi:hypothetical protein